MEKTNPDPKSQSDIEKLHWMIHEACYAISQGKTEEAHKILVEADQLSHALC